MRQFIGGGLLSCLAFAAPAEVLPLDDLLSGISSRASVDGAMADLSMPGQLPEPPNTEAGWPRNASRHVNRATDKSLSDALAQSLGIRHPLLSALRQHVIELSAVNSEPEQQIAIQQLAGAEQRLIVSSAYADWWRASETVRWCQSLGTRPVQARAEIAGRVHSGSLLASEAMLLDSRWQAVTVECLASGQALTASKVLLERLSQRSLEFMEPIAEPLSLTVQPIETWRKRLDLNLSVYGRAAELSHKRSGFSSAQGSEGRQGTSRSGDAPVASPTLSSSIDLMSDEKIRDPERSEQGLGSRERLRAEHGAILQALQHAVTAQHRASLSLSPAQERFNVAKLALTEQQLSNAAGAEPDIGALQMSELEVHRAALEVINRWYTVWQQLSGVQLFFTDNAQRTALTGGNMAHWVPLNANTADFKASSNWEQGVYMWDSRALLSSAAQAETLARLERAGIKRLYIGLSAEQLAQPDIIRMLDATVMALDSRGFEPVLLLGDPDWMVPEHRASLIAIISKLGSVGFAALHLDLEVEQRGWPVAPQHVREWLDTLKQVATASPWPVEISSHYRWFTEEMGGMPCAPCELPSLGVSRVSLMIYTRSAERSAELTEKIARRWPAVHFRLAQSVEPELAPDETWADASQAMLQEQDSRWRAGLQPFAVGGIDWQAWEHYPSKQQP